MITSPCDAGECSLERVPPFGYTLRVSADGYLNYEESIEVKANTHIERSIALKKDIHLSEFRTEDTAGKVAE